MTTEALSAAEKMRRVPGIYFMGEPTGRCARVAGTGLGVWEIIEAYLDWNQSFEELADYYDWLSREQLEAAIDYWRAFPDEIEGRIAMEGEFTPEEYYAMHPWAHPKGSEPRDFIGLHRPRMIDSELL
jgi:uncharacterized protein (DUF433 family)